MIILKRPSEIKIMAEAGKRLANVLNVLASEVRVGRATIELEEISRRLIKESGCEPAFLGYKPAGSKGAYPYCLCVSMNSVVVHGQPSTEYIVKDGDIIKLDLGIRLKGFYVDSAVTTSVGKISKTTRKLIETTREALLKGIESAKVGNTTGDIGYAIEQCVKKNKFSIVESLTGHGIGKSLHEEPAVFNFGKPGLGFELKAGMVIAIEPMVAIGSGKIQQLNDESFATQDGSLSAHFEHTVSIEPSGPCILTQMST